VTSSFPEAIPHAEWDPIYERIRGEFGFDRAVDAAARDQLAALLDGPLDAADAESAVARPLSDRWAALAEGIAGASVAIVAPGSGLADGLELATAADVRLAVSTAADRLADAGITVDGQVTDLDGDPASTAVRSRAGVPVAVHAHGDNRTALDRWVPECAAASILPTTQVEPRRGVRNLGGFTDGDRAAFLAHAAGAASLRFVGWDLDDPDVGPQKRRKLDWAARLLRWLERRRDDRFAVLDGRRDSLDPLDADGE
jgi:uncharacterized Rossmann fold enzyme